jgi:hypothetical protein
MKSFVHVTAALLFLGFGPLALATPGDTKPPTLLNWAKQHDLKVEYRALEHGADRGKWTAGLKHATKGVILKHDWSPGVMGDSWGAPAATKAAALTQLALQVTRHDTLQIVPWETARDQTRTISRTPRRFQLIQPHDAVE